MVWACSVWSWEVLMTVICNHTAVPESHRHTLIRVHYQVVDVSHTGGWSSCSHLLCVAVRLSGADSGIWKNQQTMRPRQTHGCNERCRLLPAAATGLVQVAVAGRMALCMGRHPKCEAQLTCARQVLQSSPRTPRQPSAGEGCPNQDGACGRECPPLLGLPGNSKLQRGQ
jgi:hypothetical protein